jgi:hypothetical protein
MSFFHSSTMALPEGGMETPAIRSRRISPRASASGASSLLLTSAKLARNSRSSSISWMLPVMPGMRMAAQRLDARLFERVEGGACLGLGGSALPVRVGIVAGEPHRHGVALAAGDGDVAARRQARQVGEPRLVGGEQWPVGGEAHFELRLAGRMARTRRAHRGLEGRRGVGLVLLAARGWAIFGHALVVRQAHHEG